VCYGRGGHPGADSEKGGLGDTVERALVMVPPIQWYYQVVSIDSSAIGLDLGKSANSECTGYWKHLGEIRSMRHPSPRSGKTALVGFLCGGV
jgi:hypothetical protein